jgi:hypothetical protein
MISQERTCIVCGKTGAHCYPHCARCHIEYLEPLLDPKQYGDYFSDASKDMIREEIKDWKAYLEEERDE